MATYEIFHSASTSGVYKATVKAVSEAAAVRAATPFLLGIPCENILPSAMGGWWVYLPNTVHHLCVRDLDAALNRLKAMSLRSNP